MGRQLRRADDTTELDLVQPAYVGALGFGRDWDPASLVPMSSRWQCPRCACDCGVATASCYSLGLTEEGEGVLVD